jgi:hypothetical protein
MSPGDCSVAAGSAFACSLTGYEPRPVEIPEIHLHGEMSLHSFEYRPPPRPADSPLLSRE